MASLYDVVVAESVALSARAFGLGGRGFSMVIIQYVMMSLAILLVINRLAVRVIMCKRVGLDDYVILLSLIFDIGMNIVNIVGVDHGYGRHSDTIPKADLLISMKLFYSLQILYKFTINLTKISILLLYLKIFDTDVLKFRKICTYVAIYTFTYAAISIIVTIFQCTPISRSWDKSIPGTCISLTGAWYANAISNIITDLVILILPMPVIRLLRLPPRQKIALAMVFMLGIFVCGTSIARMVTLDLSSKSLDPNYGTMVSNLWTTIEANTAIICACLPMLRIPLARIFPSMFPPFQYSEDNYQYNPANYSAVNTNTDMRQSIISTHSGTNMSFANGNVTVSTNTRPNSMVNTNSNTDTYTYTNGVRNSTSRRSSRTVVEPVMEIYAPDVGIIVVDTAEIRV